MAFQKSPFLGVKRTQIPVKTSSANSHGDSAEGRATSPVGKVHNHVRLERTISPIRQLNPERKLEGPRVKGPEHR